MVGFASFIGFACYQFDDEQFVDILFLGGLQPLHYKQLLALYTDVKNLDDAEEEVDGKL